MILDYILEKLNLKNNDKAYTINGISYTYSELYKFVCNIYDFLIQENQRKEPVIVYGHKDIYMKATFLACSFAGITYVPVDESIPKERINLILNQVEPSLIIGDLQSNVYKNISKEQINNIIYKEPSKKINEIYMKANDIYYIIFTSGSTGVPKGVKVTYSNLDSCINWLKDITKIQKGIVLNQANFSFDLSVADLYLSLISGSEHFILESESKLDFTKMFEQLKLSNATLAVMTPAFADLLLLDKSFGQELMPNLKAIIFCGEKLLNTTVKKIYSRFDNINIINSYGPTECTFAVTSIDIPREFSDKENIPVGKPKKDVNVFIVDENKNEVKTKEIGEILIAGASVAEGYLGNIENNSFVKYKGEKAYLTGDLGYIEDGILYYKCRKDKQIKYKGYRIELSDIENNLQSLSYVEKAVAIAKVNKDNKVLKLITFVKLKENVKKAEIEIINDLKDKIPRYMCPKLKIIDKFPINKNGKCDERRLLEEY